MRTIKMTTGARVALDGDLLTLLETLYKELTAKRDLERTFEDTVREIAGVIGQMNEAERRQYFSESLFLNFVSYENERLGAYLKKKLKPVAEADRLHDRVHPRAVGLAAGQVERERDVLHRRQRRDEVERLEDEADVVPPDPLTLRDRDPGQLQHPLRAAPASEAGRDVRAHYEDQFAPRQLIRQQLKRTVGEGRALPLHLERRGAQALAARDRPLGHLEAHLRPRLGLDPLVGRLARRHEDQLVEAERADRLLSEQHGR